MKSRAVPRGCAGMFRLPRRIKQKALDRMPDLLSCRLDAFLFAHGLEVNDDNTLYIGRTP